MKDQHSRLYNIEILKTFAITGVVLYHCFSPYIYWDFYDSPYALIYKQFFVIVCAQYFMPIFVFISGYLFSHLYNNLKKYSDFKKFIIVKVKRLIVPYCIFYLLIENTFELPRASGHLWFILMIFWSFIFCRFLTIFKNKYLILAILLISFVSRLYGDYLPMPGIIARLGIRSCMEYFFYFYLGYLYLLYKNNLVYSTRKLMIITVVLYLITVLFLLYCEYANINSLDLFIPYIKEAGIMSFILLSFLSIDKFIANSQVKDFGIWQKISKNSYGIYIFHHWFIFIVLHFFLYLNIDGLFRDYTFIAPLILFVFISIVSYKFVSIFIKSKVGNFLIG